LFLPKNKQIYGSVCCIFYSQRNDYQWESLILSAHIYFLLLGARLWLNCKLYVYDNAQALGSCARLGGRKVITARHFIAAKMLRRVLHRAAAPLCFKLQKRMSCCRNITYWGVIATGASPRSV